MDTNEYIKKMISGKLDVYKEIKYEGITYMFQNEDVYEKFLKHELYKWTLLLPEKAMQKFIEEEFKIYCVSETIYNNGSQADGTFIYAFDKEGKKANSIIVEVDDNPGVFYHEFGHFIDLKLGKEYCEFSNALALKAIIIKEGTDFGSAFVINYMDYGMLRKRVLEDKILGFAQVVYYLDAHEYFAEAFSIFLMKPDVLKRLCPETYNYIRDIYSSFF